MLQTTKYLNKLITLFLIVISIVTFNSCDIIGDIFEAGIWSGIIIVVLVVALLIWVFSRFRGRD